MQWVKFTQKESNTHPRMEQAEDHWLTDSIPWGIALWLFLPGLVMGSSSVLLWHEGGKSHFSYSLGNFSVIKGKEAPNNQACVLYQFFCHWDSCSCFIPIVKRKPSSTQLLFPKSFTNANRCQWKALQILPWGPLCKQLLGRIQTWDQQHREFPYQMKPFPSREEM